MKLQPITYRGQTVAAATPERFFLADELRRRPPGDPETVFVCYMCAYAREVLSGGLPGPYTEHNACRFAQAALIPDEPLEREQINTPHSAAALGIPERELADALAHAKVSRDTSPAAAWKSHPGRAASNRPGACHASSGTSLAAPVAGSRCQ
jgi:hypothetical protein